jgi:hypothetical protein
MERGCFVVSEAARICLMPGCGDEEFEAAKELAGAIEKYAECKVFVEALSSNSIPVHGIGLRFVSEQAPAETLRPTRSLQRDQSLGNVLEQAGLISPSALKQIQDTLQDEGGMTLRKAVISTGLIREDDLLDALAREMGMEKVSLDQIEVTRELLAAIDPTTAQTHRVFPVRVTPSTIYIALADPLNIEITDDLKKTLGKNVVGMIAPEDEILHAIHRYYGSAEKRIHVKPPLDPTGTPQAASFLLSPPKLSETPAGETIEPLSTAQYRSHQGYSLRIDRDRIEIAATASAGLFYGVQTLIQLVRQYGYRLPTLRIEDRPDFRHRGFMLDISRGRVPTLDTHKWLVRTLAHFKINMLQLYVEHTFHFRSHPEIGEGCSPLEPEEILELDRYCRSHHVELVPSLQSFGHMGYILSLPKFRRLAETVQFKDWKKASWRKRLHGMTITPANEGTYQLLADLYSDFLPLFTSRWFNLNSDETWDLGKGRSRTLAKRVGVGRLYLHHIERIADLARRQGRRPMIWADVIHRHPELIPEVPDDLIFLDWGYSHDSPFERCERLAEQKRPFFVCPGTSGWNQVFNDVWNAAMNIRRFVAAGKQHGAVGVLNTDWGDGGHFNMPGCSLHGAVLGAAMSWNEGRPDDETFDRAFSLQAFDDAKGEMGRVIRRAGSLVRQKTGKDLKTWELWASPVEDCRPGQEIPRQVAKSMSEILREFIEALGRCPKSVRDRDGLSWVEISLGVAMLDLLVVRAQADHQRLGLSDGRPVNGMTYRQWAEHAVVLAHWFEKNWGMRSKPSNLGDILRVFKKQVRDSRALAGRPKRD